jgi:hypothetical protein
MPYVLRPGPTTLGLSKSERAVESTSFSLASKSCWHSRSRPKLGVQVELQVPPTPPVFLKEYDSMGVVHCFVQEYDSHRLGKVRSFKPDLEESPPPVFPQVFISMGLGPTICASYASGGFVALFVGEEKTLGGRSGADSAVSSKPKDSGDRRESEVWLRANMCDYNREVLIRQSIFTI